jgi:hypothetical protein
MLLANGEKDECVFQFLSLIPTFDLDFEIAAWTGGI